MKDSRAGAFGVVGICMAVFGQLFLFREVLGERAYHVVPWALLLGRATAAVLAVAARDLRRPGLGGQFLAHARPWIHAPVLLQVALVGAVFVMPAALVLGVALALLGMVELYRLAEKNGALNGDFLGAAVIWGELSALLSWSLTGAQSLPGILEWWHLF
jgi:adenosylcobinamide-GDP ribazoletransferase